LNIILVLIGILLVFNAREPLFIGLGFLIVIYTIFDIYNTLSPNIQEIDNQNEISEKVNSKLKNLIETRTEIEKYASIVTSASIHIAKSDGRISEKEIESIRHTIKREFQNEVDEYLIADIVKITKEEIKNFSVEELFISLVGVVNLFYSYLQFAGWEARIELTSILFTMIYEVALADDGIVTYIEETFFNRLCIQYSIPPNFVVNIKRTAEYNHRTRNSNSNSNYKNSNQDELKNSLKLFDLKENYTIQELEKAWKQFAVQYHPDKFHNASKEVYEMMNRKFIEAKSAYEFLKKRK
jgi:hypothetical protein